MKSTSKFVQLSAVDPEAAKQLAPGVTMLVSRRTLAEIVKEKQQLREAKPVSADIELSGLAAC